MPIESGTTISALDSQWPLSGDRFGTTDDHFRLIKDVLKRQFPGSGGNGFSIPITATEAELNRLTGVTGDVQQQLNVLTAAMALRAALASPVFSGNPTVPTQAETDNSLRIANTQWVKEGIAFNGAVNGGFKLPTWFGNGVRNVTVNWNRFTGLPTGFFDTTGTWTWAYPFDNLVTGIFFFPKSLGSALSIIDLPILSYDSLSLTGLDYTKRREVSEFFALAIGY